jgi:hypothetical protein
MEINCDDVNLAEPATQDCVRLHTDGAELFNYIIGALFS